MSRKNLIAFALVIMAFSGCKKDTDNAAAWVGTYSAVSGGGITNTYVNQVVVQEGNSFTLHIALNNTSGTGNPVTYVTLQHVTLQNATAGTISENELQLGVTDSVRYTGSVSLISGDTIKILCVGIDSAGNTNLNFYGVKQ